MAETGIAITKHRPRRKVFDTIVQRAAFQGDFKQAGEQVMVLPEDDVEVFELFQFWLNSGELLDTGESILDLSVSALIGLYLFAEARCIPQLQNLTIDALIHIIKATGKFPTGEILRIYDNTTETSPLRRLLVDISARIGELRHDWFTREKEGLYNKAFLVDLILALYDEKFKEGSQDFIQLRCNYHVHTEADRCSVSQE